MLAPDAFVPVPNAWGARGWTTATLSRLTEAQLRTALETAYAHAVQKKSSERLRKRS
jgi:hypothetical protein